MAVKTKRVSVSKRPPTEQIQDSKRWEVFTNLRQGQRHLSGIGVNGFTRLMSFQVKSLLNKVFIFYNHLFCWNINNENL